MLLTILHAVKNFKCMISCNLMVIDGKKFLSTSRRKENTSYLLTPKIRFYGNSVQFMSKKLGEKYTLNYTQHFAEFVKLLTSAINFKVICWSK